MIAVSVWKIPPLSDYPLTEDYTRSASHLRLLKPPQDALMQPITAIRTLSMAELMKAILSIFKAGLIACSHKPWSYRTIVLIWIKIVPPVQQIYGGKPERDEANDNDRRAVLRRRRLLVTCAWLNGAIAILVHEHEPSPSELRVVVWQVEEWRVVERSVGQLKGKEKIK